jgi:hypothetical protein
MKQLFLGNQRIITILDFRNGINRVAEQPGKNGPPQTGAEILR